MNQPNPPATSPTRSGVASESPDIVYILRRYAWLIVIGGILGTGVASGLFVYFAKTAPHYTATVKFQVLPPPAPIGMTNGVQQTVFTSEDSTQFILRQVELIQSDAVLQTALEKDAFQHNAKEPDSNRKSDWLEAHSVQPKKKLLHDISISPQLNAGFFRLSMTTRDPLEAATLVNAVAAAYLDEVKNLNDQQAAERLKDLKKVQDDQQAKVNLKNEDLATYRKRMGVSAMMATHTLETEWKRMLDQEYVRAQSASVAAGNTVKVMDDQRQKTGKIELSEEMLSNFVERDPRMLNLNYDRQRLEGELATVNIVSAGIQDKLKLEARLVKNAEQLKKTSEELTAEARDLMYERARSQAAALDETTKYYDEKRKEQNAKVADLDSYLVTYQGMVDEAKAQEEILLSIQQEYRRAVLQNGTTNAQVTKLGGDAVKPDDISWPIWYTFVPIGTAGGLAISFLLAYLLVLTDTRVRTPRDITRVLQLPMLGFVPDEGDDTALKGELATAIRTSPTSMTAESFRQIRSHLTAITDSSPVNTLLVASIAPGGGATTIASNLAAGMALNGLRVLLVDANFYRPGLRNVYKDMPELGLSDVITAPGSLEASIMPCEELPKLHLMSAGTRAESTSCEILESKPFREMLEKLKGRYELIIFDGAPLNLVSDSLTLAGRVDGVIAVVRAGEVSRGTVGRVRDQLRQVRANLLGFVLNAAQTSAAGYFKENYRTFYRYAGVARRQAMVAR